MNGHEIYVDLQGNQWDLGVLDSEERLLVTALKKRVKTHPDWNDFDSFWLQNVSAFYDERGFSRKKSMQTAVYQIAQDLSSRLAMTLGLVREPDYRDELREIIRTRFRSQRAFCEASGISEDMLCHVLAGRKHLSLESLAEAMSRIGYELRLVPGEKISPKSRTRPQEVA